MRFPDWLHIEFTKDKPVVMLVRFRRWHPGYWFWLLCEFGVCVFRADAALREVLE